MKSIKRLLLLISILFSILSFSILFQNFSSYQQSRFWNGEVLEKHNEKLIYKIENIDSNSSSEVYSYLLTNAKERKLIVYRGTNEIVKGLNIYNWYFYGEKMDFYTKENPILFNRILNFSDPNEKGYYINDKTDIHADGYIFQDGEGLGQIKVQSFYQLINHKSNASGVYYFVGSEKNSIAFVESLKKKFPGFQYEQLIPSAMDEKGFFKANNQSALQSFVFITIALLILVVFSLIMKSLRKVSIMIMHGYGTFKILVRNYLGVLAMSFLVIVLSHVVLFFYKFGSINRISIQMIPTLCNVYGMYVLTVCVVLLLAYFYIKKQIKVVHFVKNESSLKHITQTLYAVKFLALIVLLPSLSNCFSLSKENTLNYTSYYLNRDKIEDKYSFIGSDPNTSNTLSIADQKELMNLMDKKGGIYYDETDLLNDETESGIISIKVNDNYLKENEIYDTHNKRIRNTSVNTKVLIPEEVYHDAYFDESSLYCRGKCEYIRIKEDTNIFRYQLGMKENDTLNDPYLSGYIIYAYPSGDASMRKDLNDRYYLPISNKNALQSFLEQHKYGETLRYKQIHKDMDGDLLHYIKSETIKNGLTYFIYMAMILLITYQFIILYIDSEKLKISIKKIHGFQFLRIHKEFLQSIAFSYIGSLALLIIFKTGWNWEMIEATIILILVDVLLSLLSFWQFNRKSLISTIKGEE